MKKNNFRTNTISYTFDNNKIISGVSEKQKTTNRPQEQFFARKIANTLPLKFAITRAYLN